MTGVKIAFHKGDKLRYKFDFLVKESLNDPGRIIKKDVQSSGKTNDMELYELGNIGGFYYLRVVFKGNNKNNFTNISEIRLQDIICCDDDDDDNNDNDDFNL